MVVVATYIYAAIQTHFIRIKSLLGCGTLSADD